MLGVQIAADGYFNKLIITLVDKSKKWVMDLATGFLKRTDAYLSDITTIS